MSRVVVLNGTSSSGKTTVARAFQEIADSVFLNFSIDSILSALPQSAIDRLVAGVGNPRLRVQELNIAYYACVRELAALGRDLVIDNAITSRAQAERLVAAVDGHDVLLVAVSAPAEVLAERERARGDRTVGLASRQMETIDHWLEYDVRIDTSVVSPSAAAARILTALQAPLTAFEKSRALLERRRPAG
jgi:chloramphenicol 3-O phosphotransferase